MSLFMSRRRWIGGTLTTFLLLPALLAAGCGGGGGSSDDNNDGSSDGASSDPEVCRDYSPNVRIDSVSPNRGAIAGGTRVVIRGSGFTRCSPSRPGLVFGNAGRAEIQSFSDTEIVCTAPAVPSARIVDVRVSVTNPRGYNPNNPPSYEGLDGWNSYSDATKFTYE